MSNFEREDFEREDMELAAMLGEKFVDETVPLAEKPKTYSCKESNVAYQPSGKAVEDQWKPTKERTFMDDLKDCTKSTLLFGGLNVLIWYWEISGLMDHSIALPCMLVCAVLAGLGIGKCCKRGKC